MTIVIEMYCIYRESLLSEEELKKIGADYIQHRNKKQKVAAKKLEKRREMARVQFEKIKKEREATKK